MHVVSPAMIIFRAFIYLSINLEVVFARKMHIVMNKVKRQLLQNQ